MYLPAQVKKAIEILESNGYEAFVVGGCVRDSLMDRTVSDYDITTSATPQQTMMCFKEYKVIETGIKHGTVTVVIEHMHLEITTYRIDGEYTDNRHPNSVRFTENIKEDLLRRDFTVNAMAYSPKTGLIDFFDGQKHLQEKKIVTVGNADERFNEDALRIIRALRFASVLGFEIDDATSASIHTNRALLKNIAVERIAVELNKLIVGKNAAKILEKYRDVIAVFIPEIEPMFDCEQNNFHHIYDVWKHTLVSVDNAPNDVVLRLTMLFHDIGKPHCKTYDDEGVGHFYGHNKISAEIALKALGALKYDNDTKSAVSKLVLYHDAWIHAEYKSVRRWLGRLDVYDFFRILEVKRADNKALNPKFIPERLAMFDKIENMAREIIAQQQCFSLKDLAVNGRDMVELGLKQGKQIGEMLAFLLECVVEDDVENDKQILLNIAKNKITEDAHE